MRAGVQLIGADERAALRDGHHRDPGDFFIYRSKETIVSRGITLAPAAAAASLRQLPCSRVGPRHLLFLRQRWLQPAQFPILPCSFPENCGPIAGRIDRARSWL